jgi:hypothetical protein
MYWSEDGHGWAGKHYYEPVDYLVEMITAFCRGAQAAGREYGQKGFSSRPYQERMLVEAIGKVPRDVPMRCSTQMQIGDFNPFMASPALVPANQTRPMTMYIDCFGEYLGRSQVPYCFPEHIQYRLRWAIKHSAALDAVRARINSSARPTRSISWLCPVWPRTPPARWRMCGATGPGSAMERTLPNLSSALCGAPATSFATACSSTA